jgi:hypothetical protein
MLQNAIKYSLLAGLLTLSTVSVANTYSFTQLLGNSNADIGISGTNQLLVDVTSVGANVNFRFTNAVGTSSSITAIYFDDVDPALFSSISNDVLGAAGDSTGVIFDDGANPSNLPQGNTVGFDATASGDSDSPGQIVNGVDAAGEWVDFLGTLSTGNSFNAVIAALNSGTFRIGLSVQSTQGRGADRYEVGVPSAVPLPGAVWLFGSGLMGLVGYKRRNSSR